MGLLPQSVKGPVLWVREGRAIFKWTVYSKIWRSSNSVGLFFRFMASYFSLTPLITADRSVMTGPSFPSTVPLKYPRLCLL